MKKKKSFSIPNFEHYLSKPDLTLENIFVIVFFFFFIIIFYPNQHFLHKHLYSNI